MSKIKVMERIASWSINEDSIAQFRYEIDGKQFLFNVTRESMPCVLRDIGLLAASNCSPMTWHDAAYLTSMIRDVMNMLEPKSIEDDDNNILVGNDINAVAWSILMMAYTISIALATFVFVMWGM